MKVRASAPGKVVLLGEYAVLFGAPSLVMAVDRRAKVEIRRGDRPGIELIAPEVWPRTVQVELLESGAIGWPDEDPALRSAFSLVAEILTRLHGDRLLPTALACSIRIDTSELFEVSADGRRSKLGLGSSAALTVALASALAMFCGHDAAIDDRTGWHRRLFELHRAFQGGRGSGVDIAASLHGGTLRYRLENGEPRTSAAHWPTELLRIMVWTGSSASTPAFLARLDAWRDAEPVESARCIDALVGAAGSAAEVAQAGTSGAEMLDACRDFINALQQFSAASKIAVFSDDHRRISNVVAKAGAVYKPCGAGGGDLGMALTLHRELLSRLAPELEAAGFPTLNLAENPAGLRCVRVPAGTAFEED